MVWLWGFLIFFFFIVFISIPIWFGYLRAVDMVGREAARRHLRHVLPVLLLTFILGFVITFLGEQGWISLYIFGAIGTSVWLLTWFFRKKESGYLLINIGRTSINKSLLWMGMFYALFTILLTWLFFVQISAGLPPSTSLEVRISQLAFIWVSAIFLLTSGLSHLEFRENGICFMLTFFNWQRVTSYNWEPSKPNTLTIWFKPRFPLIPKFISIPIPTKHRDVVSQILHERLPEKNL
jgi:hypothetical protein